MQRVNAASLHSENILHFRQSSLAVLVQIEYTDRRTWCCFKAQKVICNKTTQLCRYSLVLGSIGTDQSENKAKNWTERTRAKYTWKLVHGNGWKAPKQTPLPVERWTRNIWNARIPLIDVYMLGINIHYRRTRRKKASPRRYRSFNSPEVSLSYNTHSLQSQSLTTVAIQY